MVDNPHPIERTGADPVTPDAVRARSSEVFGGIDLGVSGTYPNSFGTITVKCYEGGMFIARAVVNGIEAYRMERIEAGEYHTFNGTDSGREVRLILTDGGEVRITRRTLQRSSGTSNFASIIDETIKDPGARVEIAQIMGIKV